MAGIYIHVPFCRHKCSYFDFTSFPDKIDYAEAYMACLYKELKMRGEELKDYVFDTVYFGGGTPSYIPPKLISINTKWRTDCLSSHFFCSPLSTASLLNSSLINKVTIEKVISEFEIKAFNNPLELYAGSGNGMIVTNVLDKIITNNKTKDQTIVVKYMEIETQNEDEIKNIKRKAIFI